VSLLLPRGWALATSVRRRGAALLLSWRRDSAARGRDEPPSLRGGGIAAAGAPVARGAASVRYPTPEEGSCRAAARCHRPPSLTGTLPHFHAGRPPRNKEIRYPADPPRVEEIVAVMRQAGNGVHGARIRGLIVVLWRAGLRISEAFDLAEADLDPDRAALLVRRGKGGKRREAGMDDWGWDQLRPWLEHRGLMPVGPLFCVVNGPTRGRPWSGSAAREQLRRLAVAAGGEAPVCAPPTAPRPRGRDGARGRAVERDPAPARSRQPRRDLQGIDNTEVISTIHARRAPTMPASAGLLM
jgi:integrase